LAIWVVRSGQFGCPSAISLILVCPPTSALRRAPPIQIRRKNVSPTSTKTGSKTIWTDIETSPGLSAISY